MISIGSGFIPGGNPPYRTAFQQKNFALYALWQRPRSLPTSLNCLPDGFSIRLPMNKGVMTFFQRRYIQLRFYRIVQMAC